MFASLDGRRFGVAVAAVITLFTTVSGGAATEDVVQEMVAQRPVVAAAKALHEAVRADSDAGYAGIVLEDGFVRLWWKGHVPAHVWRAVSAAQRFAPVEVAQARHSRAQLLAAAAAIRKQFGREAIHGIKDPGDGSRLILAVPLAKADSASRSAIEKALPAVGVAAEISPEQEPQLVSRNDDSPPWKGGAVIVNATIGAGCTSGFGVIAAGRAAVLTAGHCATANGQRIQDGAGEFIGNATQKTGHDQMIVPTTSTTNRIYVGPRSSNTTKTVTSWEPCFIGELLCQSGVTTAQAIGSELCRLRVDRFATDSESLVEAVQLDGQTGARPGDSGGPLYSDQGATVIAKGTMTWVSGSRVGFQDIPTANADFGGIQIPSGGTPGPTPTPTPTPPATGPVQLYQHCDFAGWRASFNTTGNISTAQIQAAGGINNDASSIRIAAGYRVTLFDLDGQAGTSVTLTGDTACFVGVNFNDMLSSMRIESTASGVVFFQHSNFSGTSTQPLGPGDYTLSALQARGFVNDWASSVRVPAGRTVTMYQHDGFTGTSWTVQSDVANLTNLSPSANDHVSSVRVR